VLVETRAGALSSLTDEEYREAGARIVPAAAEVWHGAQVVVKVKEPQPSEYGFFRPDLTLFTYLQPGANRGIDGPAAGIQGDGHRLRNHSGEGRLAALPDPDERSGGPDGGAGRSAVPGSA